MAKKRFPELPASDFKTLPGPLFTLLSLYEEESTWFRKVHRLIDAVEWAVKWHTVLVMSDLLGRAELPDEIKVLLSSGLRTPSLGTWNRFFRDAVAAVRAPAAPWDKWERLTALEKSHRLVAFRNRYAHGATPEEDACRADCDTYYPVLQQLIGSPLFTEVALVAGGDDRTVMLKGPEERPAEVEMPAGRAGALLPDGSVLNLWPLAVYARDPGGKKGWGFFYFNALKSQKVEQLNYEKPCLLRDRAVWAPFHETLPLKQWGRIGSAALDLFRSNIESLTESFKGRLAERRSLKEFCLTGSGTLMLWGAPGIGKSTLLAQVFREMRAGITPEGEDKGVEYPPVIEYFIRRNTVYASRAKFLRYVNEKLDQIFALQNIPTGKDEAELWDNLVQRLNAIEDMAGSHELVLFVDGLDEHPDIARVVPDSRPWLRVIVSSRQEEGVQNWWRTHDREHRREETVGPMDEKEDIRALLYDVVDKYQSGFDHAYVRAVAQRSEGNPLYLKLLCDRIYEQGGIVDSIEDLPRDMVDLYEDTLKRVSDSGSAKNVLALLRLLAEAKAALSVAVITEILDEFDSQQVKAAIDGCRELLFEDPLTPDVEDFQLFHESLRQWLRQNHARECRAMACRLADLTFSWSRIEDEETRKYALAHAADHLYDRKDHERLWALMNDEAYRTAQIKTCNQYQPALDAIQKAVDLYIQRNGETDTDDARLCWLALRAGDLGHQARTDISAAFDWLENRPLDDPARIEDALERLSVLDEENFFKAAVLMLWIEADRQAELPEEHRKPEYALRILDEADQRIPEGIERKLRLHHKIFGSWWIVKLQETFGIAVGDLFLGFWNEIGDMKHIEFILQFGNKIEADLYHLLIPKIENMDGQIAKTKTILALTTILAQPDRPESLPVLNRILRAADTINRDDCRKKIVADVCAAIAKAGDFDQAIQTAEAIEDHASRSLAFAQISGAMSAIGNFKLSLRAAESITIDFYKAIAFFAFGISMAISGCKTQAEKYLKKSYRILSCYEMMKIY